MEDFKGSYLEDLLESIPVVKNFDIEIKKIETNRVQILSPLSTHINYEGTAFGGSLNTSCVLASYLLTHHLMKINNIAIKSLVIQNSAISYLHPVEADFLTTSFADEAEVEKFIRMLRLKGIARINITSKVATSTDGADLVEFSGRFVAHKA